MKKIEEKTKINGWYIAAGYEDEVWNALNKNKDVINNALKSSGNQEFGSSMDSHQEFWTSTPSFSPGDTYATSITMRQLDFSKYACVSYVISLILRILFDLMITQTAHWGFLIILTAASLISILRYISVSKGNRKRRKAMRKNFLSLQIQ